MSNLNKERTGSIYKSLWQPWIYKTSLALLAPGSQENFNRRIKTVIEAFPDAKSYLDVGCGPYSRLSGLGLNVIGFDLSRIYVANHISTGSSGVVGSADLLPFEKDSFDAVWTIGLLHHLPAPMFQMACSEMQRVCRPGGYIAIIDAVFPNSIWAHLIPALLRKLDRGRYVRGQEQFEQLAKGTGDWSFERFTYTSNGLEGMFALHIKEK